MDFSQLSLRMKNIKSTYIYGKVRAIRGGVIEIAGLEGAVAIGQRLAVLYHEGSYQAAQGHDSCLVEIVGFNNNLVIALSFSSMDGIGPDDKVYLLDKQPVIYPNESWLGRVIDAFGDPIDNGPLLYKGPKAYPIRAQPMNAHKRKLMGKKIDVGVRAINCFTPCCQGQRMGIFAGSGVGKSILLSMIARYSDVDVIVIGLIGERGREVQDFLQNSLPKEALQRVCVIVATSDESALKRREAAWTTLSIAEYFRDQDKQVLCLMDSVTRFAMAQREISLSTGEPPAARGYTPSCFSHMSQLLERAGPGVHNSGDITALFTVLVDGDDHNEPVSDAARGILDGHIVLDRKIAHRGRYPAINILQSISRAMPACNSNEENALVNYSRNMLATYEDMAELIRLGAYKVGSNPDVDLAIKYYNPLEQLLSQDINECVTMLHSYQQLAKIFSPSEHTSLPNKPSS